MYRKPDIISETGGKEKVRCLGHVQRTSEDRTLTQYGETFQGYLQVNDMGCTCRAMDVQETLLVLRHSPERVPSTLFTTCAVGKSEV